MAPGWGGGAAWWCVALLGCTDAGLQGLVDDVSRVDDKLAVRGEICTSPPDEVAFPVKILIVMDQSASLQCTDPGNVRLSALNTAAGALDALPNVEFGVVGFASWSKLSVFTPDWSTAAAALAPAGGAGGPATDYQGSLATTLSLVEQDILESGPAQTARTRYVVLFVSDGVPEPRCTAGCDDGGAPPDSLYGVCNTTEEIEEETYVDMHTQCPDYNQDAQIRQKVEDLIALGEFYGVGELTLSTVLLFADQADVEAVCGDVAQFGYVRDEAEPLMKAMAEAGRGTYRDVNLSDEIDFLDFDYESLEAPYQVAQFYARNTNAVPREDGPEMDSDGDGLGDDEEFAAVLDRLDGDTDGDGFGDFFEVAFSGNGFDGRDAGVPAGGCADASDRDGDALTGCEEEFLDTNPLLTDTDGDRVPDGLELRLRMDPLLIDTTLDHDLDGVTSGLEMAAGTHPQLYDEVESVVDAVRSSVVVGAQGADGSTCYTFAFEGLTLEPTLATDADNGRNRVLVVAEEEPVGLSGSRGRFRVACVEARYLGDTFKDPPSGEIEGLVTKDFVDLQAFVPGADCRALDATGTTGPGEG